VVQASDIWGPLGVIVGVIAILTGLVFAWWFARGPKLVMQTTGTTLISAPADERIAVLYMGVAVSRVTQTFVWLWREGRGTVNGDDVAASDPITLRIVGDGTMLTATLIAQTKTTNEVAVAFDPDHPEAGARVTFDYLEPRQGAVMEVLHTGESSDLVEPARTIKGIPKGITRITESAEVTLPMGIAGTVVATVPTHTIPKALRVASGVETDRQIDWAPSALIATAIRSLLPSRACHSRYIASKLGPTSTW
jgi:hypothetical protein